MRIGINTLLFVWPFTNKNTSLFRKAKKWGLDTIEIAVGAPSDFDAAFVRRELDKAGLACGWICAILGADRDLRGTRTQQQTCLKYLREVIDQAVVLGASKVVGPAYSAVGRADAVPAAEKKRQWKTVVGNLRQIGAYAVKKKVQICVEPLNRFETDFLNTAEQAVQLARDVNSPGVNVMLDTFHMNIEEKDSAAAIRKAGKLLGHVHACGCDRGTPGKDHINWPEIVNALRDVGYDGDLVIESFSTHVEMIAKAAAIWRKIEPSQEDIAVQGSRFLRGLMGEKPRHIRD